MQGLSSDFEQLLPGKNNLLTSVYNEADYDANDYNKVIGLAHLKVFSCSKNQINYE